MFEPGLDVLRYKFTFLFLALQALSALPRRPGSVDLRERPSSDATWFLPVYVWGVESAYHAYSFIFLPSRFCFGIPIEAVGLEAVKAFLAGGITLAASLACEATARRRLLAVRTAGASVPLGVLAAFLAVQMTWIAVGLATVPLIAEKEMSDVDRDADEGERAIRFTTTARAFRANRCNPVRGLSS